MTHALRAPISLGQYMSQLLAECKENQSDLSRATDISEPVIKELAAGGKILTGDVAITLADHLGVSAIGLLDVQCLYHLSFNENAAHAAIATA